MDDFNYNYNSLPTKLCPHVSNEVGWQKAETYQYGQLELQIDSTRNTNKPIFLFPFCLWLGLTSTEIELFFGQAWTLTLCIQIKKTTYEHEENMYKCMYVGILHRDKDHVSGICNGTIILDLG